MFTCELQLEVRKLILTSDSKLEFLILLSEGGVGLLQVLKASLELVQLLLERLKVMGFFQLKKTH